MVDPSGPEVRRFIGLIVIVIGMLWLVLTGLCSATFTIGFLLAEDSLYGIGAVPMIGVPSALIGGVIYAIGRWLRRKA